jgi:hypothetical protein
MLRVTFVRMNCIYIHTYTQSTTQIREKSRVSRTALHRRAATHRTAFDAVAASAFLDYGRTPNEWQIPQISGHCPGGTAKGCRFRVLAVQTY